MLKWTLTMLLLFSMLHHPLLFPTLSATLCNIVHAREMRRFSDRDAPLHPCIAVPHRDFAICTREHVRWLESYQS